MRAEHVPTEDSAWRVTEAKTSVVAGIHDRDERMSTMVMMTLHCEDLSMPGRFAMPPDHARMLAGSLWQAAADADRAEQEMGL